MSEEKARNIIKEELDNIEDIGNMQPQEWINFIIQVITEHPFMCMGLCLGCFIDVIYKNRKQKKETSKSIPNADLKVIKGGN